MVVHDVAAEGPVLDVDAKLPDVHPVQVRSVVALPAAKTWPVGQLADQGVHDVAVPALAT